MANQYQLTLLATLLMPGWLVAAERPWSIDVTIGGGKNTNIGNAERHRDIIDDNFGVVTAGANYVWAFGPQSVTARGFAEAELLDEISDLSRYTGGGRLIYRRQLNPLPTSASLEASLNAQVDNYDVNQRDSTVASAQVLISKPLFGRANLSVGAEYSYRDSEGSVWDLAHYRGFLNGNVSLLQGWSIYGNYSYIDGEVASTAQTRFSDGSIPGDIFGLIAAAKDIENDDAFNNRFSDRRWTAYSLPATSNAVKLGIKKQFAQGFILDISAFSVWVKAKANNDYDTQVYRASLQKRF
ncbi:MAG: hypothetical protein V3W04_00770 [Gammaproteobacteria bacterium]